MTKFFPTYPRMFGRQFCLEPEIPPSTVTQQHLVKHVLGLAALAETNLRTSKNWNEEGWDSTQPPVLTAVERRVLVAGIQALSVLDNRCAIPNLERESTKGGRKDDADHSVCCERCPAGLCDACAHTTGDVALRYFNTAESILDPVAGDHAVAVSRVELRFAAMRMFAHNRSSLDPLVVFTIGEAQGKREKRVARLASFSGLRVEFRVHRNVLTWRTTYRASDRQPANLLAFALEAHPRPNGAPAGTLLSDLCLVPRLWWETHAQR